MPASPDESDREEVVAAYRAHLRAMPDGDTDALDDLLDDGFTLTHITGYQQPKAEWLSQMRAGRFVYHGVIEKNVTVDVDVDRDTARLVSSAASSPRQPSTAPTPTGRCSSPWTTPEKAKPGPRCAPWQPPGSS